MVMLQNALEIIVVRIHMKFHNSETSEDPLPSSSRQSSSSQPLVSLSQVELTNGNNNAGFGETLGNVASIPCGTDIVDGEYHPSDEECNCEESQLVIEGYVRL